MADYIPFEIQADIIKRLAIKSLIQCRSVSKSWKSLIDSSEFIADYNILHTQPQRILVRYVDSEDSEQKYVSLVDDDDTFPWQKYSLTVPQTVKELYEPRLVGCSQGLFCFFSYMEKPSDSGTKMAVLWNPAIRKSVEIVVPNVLDWPYQTFVGFCVCPDTNDPKLVKISNSRIPLEIDSLPCIPWQVEVFTLSSGIWRSPLINVPRKAIVLSQSLRVIDRFIYWLASKRIPNIELPWSNLIIFFDIASEAFTEVELPDSLAIMRGIDLYLSKLRESLVVLEFDIGNRVCGVWMMDHGVPKSFTKLFNIINTPNAWIGIVVGFIKSGQPIVQMIYGFEEKGALAVYEPYLGHIIFIGIFGEGFSFFGDSYVERLLLLDQ